MRRLHVVLCLSLCAGSAWAGLDHVKAVTGDARSFAMLSRIEAVDSVMPETMAMPATTRVSLDEAASMVFVALGKLARLEADIVAIDSLPGLACCLVVDPVPCLGRYSGCEALAMTLPCSSAMPGILPLVCGSLPSSGPIGVVAALDADPFLTGFDIWGDGALGELRGAAIKAAKSGDNAAYRENAARYWSGVAIATERRRVLVEKPGDDASGIRGAKRSGP